MYIEGDVINSFGVIEKNHCGLPWLAGQDGLYYGVLQVRLFSNYESVYIDAVSGKILSQDEINERLNNEKFNYENKGSDEWYSKNRERIKKIDYSG
jgi:hypothetical protein